MRKALVIQPIIRYEVSVTNDSVVDVLSEYVYSTSTYCMRCCRQSVDFLYQNQIFTNYCTCYLIPLDEFKESA